MDKVKPVYLSEFMPKSELVVEENIISKSKFPVIDVHSHMESFLYNPEFKDKTRRDELVETWKSLGLKKVVNLDGFWGNRLDRMLEATEPYEDFIVTFGGIDVSNLDDRSFERYVLDTVRESVGKGIKGLKFFKELSLATKDNSGKYIPADDKRLNVIWQAASEYKLPVLIHIGDPAAFFKPVDMYNERYEELSEHPNWSFCGKEFFKFEELMEMMQNLLGSNPSTTFIIPHVGCYPENLSFVGACLDRYPNMYIDTAARISELGRVPYSSRIFLNKYQDRILFGTDGRPDYHSYPINFRFFETWDEYFDYSNEEIPSQGRWKIYGISLEDSVLEKVYCRNAENVLRI